MPPRYDDGWPTPLNRYLLYTSPDALPPIVLKLQLHASLQSKQRVDSDERFTSAGTPQADKPWVRRISSSENSVTNVRCRALVVVVLTSFVTTYRNISCAETEDRLCSATFSDEYQVAYGGWLIQDIQDIEDIQDLVHGASTHALTRYSEYMLLWQILQRKNTPP